MASDAGIPSKDRRMDRVFSMGFGSAFFVKGDRKTMEKHDGILKGFEQGSGAPFGRSVKRSALVVVMSAAAILSSPGCIREFSKEPTVVIVKEKPDDLSTILANEKTMARQFTNLGGQIVRRVDTPVGRYFLIRAMKLSEDSYPTPPKSKIVFMPDTQTAFVLFAPSHYPFRMSKRKTARMKSAFVVYGGTENLTVELGPGHLITAVGEVKGMVGFPGEPKGPRYLLVVGRYILLWSEANPSDYPPIGE